MKKSPKKLGLKLISAFIFIGISISFYVTRRNFFPSEAREILGPIKGNRVFAKKIESRDATVGIMVSDWPYTFFKPYFLGEGEWPEKFSTIEYFWSADGSVFACRVKEIESSATLWESAYDFEKHAVIAQDSSFLKKSDCDKAIANLLEARGGKSDSAAMIPDVKNF